MKRISFNSMFWKNCRVIRRLCLRIPEYRAYGSIQYHATSDFTISQCNRRTTTSPNIPLHFPSSPFFIFLRLFFSKYSFRRLSRIANEIALVYLHCLVFETIQHEQPQRLPHQIRPRCHGFGTCSSLAARCPRDHPVP
jgi:hypothetical protein